MPTYCDGIDDDFRSVVPPHVPAPSGKETTNPMMSRLRRFFDTQFRSHGCLSLAGSLVLADRLLFFQNGSSPWENAVQVLETAFTGPIATGLSLVAIVVSGLVFAFGEGGAKRTLAGILFGVGMAVGAVNFMAWLFPGA
jgi:type IV secretion system protein TrbC